MAVEINQLKKSQANRQLKFRLLPCTRQKWTEAEK